MNTKSGPDQSRSPAIWIVVGMIVMVASSIALFRLGTATGGLLVGGPLASCLAMVAMVLWMDRNAARAERSNHYESTRR